MTRAIRLDAAPPWSLVGEHSMSPRATHDEIARFNFLANFNKYMSNVVVSGNAVAYERRVAPRWRARHGVDPANRREIRAAMSEDPYYQMWSALRRTGMEMRQQAGRSLVLRQIQALRDRARQLNAECAATLRLDESIAIPRYQSELDNHCMPGSYYAEYIEDDVSAAANYDAGMFATTTGLFGRYLDGAGRGAAQWLSRHRPGWRRGRADWQRRVEHKRPESESDNLWQPAAELAPLRGRRPGQRKLLRLVHHDAVLCESPKPEIGRAHV